MSEPTAEQQARLTRLLYLALLELRILGWEGKAEQVAQLADAFHNLPLHLYSPDFDWEAQRRLLAGYCERYGPGERRFNYVAAFDRIRRNEPDPVRGGEMPA